MSQQKPSSKKRESSREPWPFSAAASLVNRLAAPASEKATQMRDGYGMKCSASFAKLGPDGYWQKTCGGYYQPVLFSTDGTCSEEYSETWPKMGIVRDGFAMALEMLGRPTRGKESLSWRTPEAGDSANRVFAVNSRGEPKLSAQVKVPAGWWPTPTTQEVEHPTAELTKTGRRKSRNGENSHSLGLADSVKMWPTPRAGKTTDENLESWQERQKQGQVATPPLTLAVKMWPTPHSTCSTAPGKQGRQGGENLQTAAQGQLNPAWVTLLMGFPPGWLDIDGPPDGGLLRQQAIPRVE